MSRAAWVAVDCLAAIGSAVAGRRIVQLAPVVVSGHQARGAAANPVVAERAARDDFAVATIRPIIGIFFATSRVSGMAPHAFFGIAFWVGFTLHLIVARAWIHATAMRVAAVAVRG